MAEAVKAAYEELLLTGFWPIAGGTLEGQALYRRALELIAKAQSEQAGSSDDLPDAPGRRDPGADVRARASAAIVDAAFKEGRHLDLISRFSRIQVQNLEKADEQAAGAVAAAVSGERQAQRGVAGALQQAVQGLLRAVLGREPHPDAAASAVSEAAGALERGGQLAPAGAPSPAAANAVAEGLAASLPATVAELRACRDALAQELQVLCARSLEEQKAAVLLRRQREAAREELGAVRRELEACGRNAQLLRSDLQALQASQKQECDQAARKINAQLQAVVLQAMDSLAGNLSDGLAPARGRLDDGEEALKASGAALDAAETAAHGRAEAAAAGARARSDELGELCGRLEAAGERAARAAGAAEAAASRAASGLCAAAEGLKGVGEAHGKAEDAREQLDAEFQRYRAGHRAALEEHHTLFEDGRSRAPLALFKEFHGEEHQSEPHTPERRSTAKPPHDSSGALTPEKCEAAAEPQHPCTKRPASSSSGECGDFKRPCSASSSTPPTECSAAPAEPSKARLEAAPSSPVPTNCSEAVSE